MLLNRAISPSAKPHERFHLQLSSPRFIVSLRSQRSKVQLKSLCFFFNSTIAYLLKNEAHSHPMSLWCTATAGLEIGKNNECNNAPHVHYRSSSNNNRSKMSQPGDDLHHTPRYLSWRKLQLSRAKLKASSKTSALLSGFAMVAMVEVQLQTPTTIPSAVLVTFAIITTLLVAVHMLALMISTCILPNIEAICSMDAIHLVEESPHEKLHWYIETAWAFSTLLGLLLFLAEIAVLCWVKFYEIDKTAAWSACIILIPVLFVFLAFAVHFYRSLVSHKYEMTVSGIRELEMLKEQIELGDADHNRGNGLGDIMTGVRIV